MLIVVGLLETNILSWLEALNISEPVGGQRYVVASNLPYPVKGYALVEADFVLDHARTRDGRNNAS